MPGEIESFFPDLGKKQAKTERKEKFSQESGLTDNKKENKVTYSKTRP